MLDAYPPRARGRQRGRAEGSARGRQMGLVPSAERIDSCFFFSRRVEGEEIETLWMERGDRETTLSVPNHIRLR